MPRQLSHGGGVFSKGARPQGGETGSSAGHPHVTQTHACRVPHRAPEGGHGLSRGGVSGYW